MITDRRKICKDYRPGGTPTPAGSGSLRATPTRRSAECAEFLGKPSLKPAKPAAVRTRPGKFANFFEFPEFSRRGHASRNATRCVTSVASCDRMCAARNLLQRRGFCRAGDPDRRIRLQKAPDSTAKTADFERKVAHGCVTCVASLDFSQFQRFGIFLRISGAAIMSDFGRKIAGVGRKSDGIRA
jgi:hypothetical protein